MGTHKGYVQIWDAGAGKRLSTLEGHTARVGENICSETYAGRLSSTEHSVIKDVKQSTNVSALLRCRSISVEC